MSLFSWFARLMSRLFGWRPDPAPPTLAPGVQIRPAPSDIPMVEEESHFVAAPAQASSVASPMREAVMRERAMLDAAVRENEASRSAKGENEARLSPARPLRKAPSRKAPARPTTEQATPKARPSIQRRPERSATRIGSPVDKAPQRASPTPAPPMPEPAGAPALNGSGPLNSEGAVRQSADGTGFPRFRSTASDQVDPRLSDNLANVRMKLRNAFTPSQPVTDRKRFAGRAQILAELISAIEDRRLHAVIFGERGIGKTSMLHVLTQAAREARYLVVYIPGGAESNFDEMFRAFAGAIPLRFHTSFGPTSQAAEQGQTVADLLPETPVTVRLASDLLAKLTGTRVLVVLDEFDRCLSTEFRRNIAELLKALSDRSARVQLVIAGVAANLTELVDFVPSIQRNIFALQVPKMTAAELRHLVRTGEEETGLAFEEGAVGLIVAVANGLPYFASLLSHHAGLIALGQGRMVVRASDIGAAFADVLHELEGRVSKRSQALLARFVPSGSPEGLAAVAVAAQSSGGQFTLEDIAILAGGAAHVDECKQLLGDMVASDLVVEGMRQGASPRPAYRFAEDSVPAYLWLLAVKARVNDGHGATPVAAPAAALLADVLGA